jgi:hypothetical protein
MMVISYRTLIEATEFSQPKSVKPNNERAQSKKWCKLARGFNSFNAVRSQRPEDLNVVSTPKSQLYSRTLRVCANSKYSHQEVQY